MMNFLKREIKPKTAIAVIISFILLCIILFCLLELNLYLNNSNKPTANTKVIQTTSILVLEKKYLEEHDLYTLKEIIDYYGNEEIADYNKKLYYYEELFKRNDVKDLISYKSDYASVLYMVGKKEEYYKIVNVLLNDKDYMENELTSISSEAQRLANTIHLTSPILKSSLSDMSDYDYVLNKFSGYEKVDISKWAKFADYYSLFRTLCKLYKEMGSNEKSDYYKNETIELINEQKIPNETKQLFIDNFNEYMNGKTQGENKGTVWSDPCTQGESIAFANP